MGHGANQQTLAPHVLLTRLVDHHSDEPSVSGMQAGVLAVGGAVLCLVDLPSAPAQRVDAAVMSLWGCGGQVPAGSKPRAGSEREGGECGVRVATRGSRDEEAEPREVQSLLDATLEEEEEEGGSSLGAVAPRGADAAVRIQTSPLAVAVAWTVLAVTAGIGIVCTTYFEQEAGLGMFGYAAVDQVLLPFTTIPLLALASAWPVLATALGEPEMGRKQGVWATAAATWAEIDWLTLVLFRAPMFGREFVFFWLVTAFSDLSTTYLQMTIVRIVMCWLLSLLVCTVLREWAGVSFVEAQRSIRPSTLILRIMGTAILILSYLRLQQSL